MNAMQMRAHAQRAGMGELGLELTAQMKQLGYTKDWAGNILYPDGGYFLLAPSERTERPRVIDPSALTGYASNTITLPNGQQISLTAEQFAAYQAAQRGAPGSTIATGLGEGFAAFAAQFGVSPTTLVILFIAGAYLLFRPPPERKR